MTLIDIIVLILLAGFFAAMLIRWLRGRRNPQKRSCTGCPGGCISCNCGRKNGN